MSIQSILLAYTKNHHLLIHILDNHKNCLFSTIQKANIPNSIYTDSTYQNIFNCEDVPCFHTMNQKELYASFSYQNKIYIIGPVLYNFILTFQDQYHLSFYSYLKKENLHLYHEIPIMSLETFSSHVSFIYTLITNKNFTLKQKQKDITDAYSNLQWEQFDLRRTLKMIEDVIINQNSEKLTLQHWNGYPSLMSYDANKQAMYIFVSLLTYCTNIAVNHGLSLKKALQLKDQYILKADTLQTKSDLFNLFQSYMFNLCEIMPSKHQYSYEINQCITYINDHLNEDLSTSLLANQIHLNRTYLCRRFKQETNMTIAHFILNKRLELSKSLLINTSKSLETICQLCGFKSLSYFSTAFKKVYHLSPSAFKKSNSHIGN